VRFRRVSKLNQVSVDLSKERLILDHLTLVRSIAASVRLKLPAHVEIEDLIHDGICGLIEAAERYDVTRKTPFAAYAGHRIRGAIVDGLRRSDPASRDLRAKAKRIEAATQQLGNRFGRSPTTAEIAAEAGITVGDWSLLFAERPAMAIVPDRAGKSGDMITELGADEALETDVMAARAELRKALRGAMSVLPPRDRQIVILYHWRCETMREISRLFRINESRVSQIHKRALERLGVALRSAGITSTASILLH
jgi:RNA polymerase sigma factor FliA